MTSTHTSALPSGPAVPSVADAASDLASAVHALASADRETCRAVLALSRTVGTGVCETVDAAPPIDTDTTRGQRLAIGLERLAEEHLAGAPAAAPSP